MIERIRCPICLNTIESRQDENECWHFHCSDCGYDSNTDGGPKAPHNSSVQATLQKDRERAALEMETPGWPGDGSGMDDLADFNANEADDYRNE